MSTKLIPKPKPTHQPDNPLSDWPKVVIGVIIFGLTIAAYVNEASWASNTFEIKSMAITGGILGVLVGLAIGYRFSKDRTESIEQFQINVAAIVIGVFFMPVVLSMINRMLDFSEPKAESVEFVESSAFMASRFGKIGEQSPDGYHTFVIRQGEVFRLTSKKQWFPHAKEGDTVLLPIKKGLLGYSIAIMEQRND